LESYQLSQERQPEIGDAMTCQRMLAFLLFLVPFSALILLVGRQEKHPARKKK